MLIAIFINHLAQIIASALNFIIEKAAIKPGEFECPPQIIVVGVTTCLVFGMQIYFAAEMKRIRIFLESKDPTDLKKKLEQFKFQKIVLGVLMLILIVTCTVFTVLLKNMIDVKKINEKDESLIENRKKLFIATLFFVPAFIIVYSSLLLIMFN